MEARALKHVALKHVELCLFRVRVITHALRRTATNFPTSSSRMAARRGMRRHWSARSPCSLSATVRPRRRPRPPGKPCARRRRCSMPAPLRSAFLAGGNSVIPRQWLCLPALYWLWRTWNFGPDVAFFSFIRLSVRTLVRSPFGRCKRC